MEWTGARYADKPTVQVQTWIVAPPHRVWEIVSDIELMPTMSQELQSVEWLDGATEPVVGARFVGHSKHEALGEWATTSHVIECEPERVLAWAVEDPPIRRLSGVFGCSPRMAGPNCRSGCRWARPAQVCRLRSIACRTRSRRSCSFGCASSSAT